MAADATVPQFYCSIVSQIIKNGNRWQKIHKFEDSLLNSLIDAKIIHMPPKHEITKTHKKSDRKDIYFSDIWCFCDFVAKGNSKGVALYE